jgi:hypothetical protein
VGIVGLLKNTLRSNTKKGITKEQHITQSLLLGGNWVGLFKIKHKERNHKRAAHHQSLLLGGNCRTVEKYLKTKHKERNHKRAAHHQSLL